MDQEKFFTGLKNVFTAYTRVAYVMLIVFGGEVISQYSHDNCHIEFEGGDFVTRDNINYILGAALFSYALAIMVFHKGNENEDERSPFAKYAQYFCAIATVALACSSIILTQFAVFVSHCETGVEEFDDDVKGLLTYGIILLTLMTAHGISSMNLFTEKNDQGRESIFQMGITVLDWTVRFLFVVFLINWLSHDDFINESLNTAQQNTSACKDVIQHGHDEFGWYEAISFVDFKVGNETTVNATTNETIKIEVPDGKNDDMFALVWSVLGVLIVEFILKAADYANYKIMNDRTHSLITDLFRGYVNVLLVIFLFSLTLANDIAACPMFNPHESRTRTVFVFATTYIALQFFMDMVRMLGIGRDGRIFPQSHMYEHFVSSMY